MTLTRSRQWEGEDAGARAIAWPKTWALGARAALGAVLVAGVLGGVAAPPPAAAQGGSPLRLSVQGGEFEPIPISLPTFRAVDPSLENYARQISAVVAGDLSRSGLFDVEGGDPLPSIDVPPVFGALRSDGRKALLAGEVGQESDGRLTVRFRLWDVGLRKQLEQIELWTIPPQWKRAAHQTSDKVYTALTGEDPYFDSRVVFIEESGPKDNRRKRLAIMDQDGEGLEYLTSDKDLVLTPRFSPAEQVITFISWAEGNAKVFLLNMDTQRQEALGNFPGMTFAPRFSPDGNRVVMSLTLSGDTDLYAMDLATSRQRRLTSSPGIETSPSFAPDGSAIVFVSDRGGSPQLYVMEPDGSKQRRISFGQGSYSTPVWSPKGDLIAFTKQRSGKFHIGVMRPDGSDERLLTSSFLDEGPTWAPNGRVLMFFREEKGSRGLAKLYTIDIYGRNLRRVPTPAGASDPAWSPLLSKKRG